MTISIIRNIEFVASGAQGMVFHDLKTGHILKYAKRCAEIDDQTIEDEAVLQQLAATYGLAPEVYSWNDDQLVIEMELIKGSLVDELESAAWWNEKYNDPSLLAELLYRCGLTLGKLHSLGILHWDPHPYNWMMKVDPVLVDFGMAITTTEEVLFAQEYKDCLYGDKDAGNPHVGLLTFTEVEDTSEFELAFSKGYCQGRGFNGN